MTCLLTYLVAVCFPLVNLLYYFKRFGSSSPNFSQNLLFDPCPNCDISSSDVHIQITVTTMTVILLKLHKLNCILLGRGTKLTWSYTMASAMR